MPGFGAVLKGMGKASGKLFGQGVKLTEKGAGAASKVIKGSKEAVNGAKSAFSEGIASTGVDVGSSSVGRMFSKGQEAASKVFSKGKDAASGVTSKVFGKASHGKHAAVAETSAAGAAVSDAAATAAGAVSKGASVAGKAGMGALKNAWKNTGLLGKGAVLTYGYSMFANPAGTLEATGNVVGAVPAVLGGVANVAGTAAGVAGNMANTAGETVTDVANGVANSDLSKVIEIGSVAGGAYAMTHGHPLLGGIATGLGLVTTMKDVTKSGGISGFASGLMSTFTGKPAEASASQQLSSSQALDYGAMAEATLGTQFKSADSESQYSYC